MTGEPPTYVCWRCGDVFTSDRTDADAEDEARATFGFIPPAHERATICTDCYAEFLAWAKAQGLVIGGPDA